MDSILDFMRNNLTDEQKKEICIIGDDNISSPMYRNGTGYIPKIEDGKIVELKAHFYF